MGPLMAMYVAMMQQQDARHREKMEQQEAGHQDQMMMLADALAAGSAAGGGDGLGGGRGHGGGGERQRSPGLTTWRLPISSPPRTQRYGNSRTGQKGSLSMPK